MKSKKNIFTLKTNTLEMTIEFGKLIADILDAGDILSLNGELGSGKTTFTKGIAQGLGIKEQVKSPTFNIVKEYRSADIPLFHIDAYRLENQKDDIGLDEYIEGNGICVIEWGKYLNILNNYDTIDITINRIDDNTREFTIASSSPQFIKELKAIGASLK